MTKKYRVYLTETAIHAVDIDAIDEKEAIEIAESLDLDDFECLQCESEFTEIEQIEELTNE